MLQIQEVTTEKDILKNRQEELLDIKKYDKFNLMIYYKLYAKVLKLNKYL